MYAVPAVCLSLSSFINTPPTPPLPLRCNSGWRGLGRSASWRERMNPPLAWDAVMFPAPVSHSAPSTAGSSGGTRTGADATPSARPATGAVQGARVASAMAAARSGVARDSGARDSGARDYDVAGGVAVGFGASRGSGGGDGDRDRDGDGDGGGGRSTRGRDRREQSAEPSRGSSISRPRLGMAAAGDEEDEEMMTDEACFEVG